jgi:acyl carrier protein
MVQGRLAISTELSAANTSLEQLSLQDGLTDLANRRCFDKYLASQIAVAHRHKRTLALAEPRGPEENSAIKGPSEPFELRLQLVFEKVLNRCPIGVDVSFFELGGDSLQALELLVQIEQITGKSLPLGTLYQTSTVESLAGRLKGDGPVEYDSPLIPLQTKPA